MIKKVVVCAAGRGTRMKHLSKDKPKMLIEVWNKPFLYYLLTNLRQAGFEEVILVTGYMTEKMEEFVRSYSHGFTSVKLINQFKKFGEDKYGTLLALLTAQEELGDEEFVVVYGDNLYSLQDLQQLRSQSDEFCYIAGFQKPNPEQYGTLVTKENGLLERIDEKVPNPVTNVINTGVGKFTSEIFTVTDKVQPNSGNGEYYLTDAITLLAQQDRVKVQELKDYWLDFGKPEDIPVVEQFIQDNDLFKQYGIAR